MKWERQNKTKHHMNLQTFSSVIKHQHLRHPLLCSVFRVQPLGRMPRLIQEKGKGARRQWLQEL
jgi:hypothetical protein